MPRRTGRQGRAQTRSVTNFFAKTQPMPVASPAMSATRSWSHAPVLPRPRGYPEDSSATTPRRDPNERTHHRDQGLHRRLERAHPFVWTTTPEQTRQSPPPNNFKRGALGLLSLPDRARHKCVELLLKWLAELVLSAQDRRFIAVKTKPVTFFLGNARWRWRLPGHHRPGHCGAKGHEGVT